MSTPRRPATAAALVSALLALTACGSAPGGAGASSESADAAASSEPDVGSSACEVLDTAGSEVARVDLDADGRPDQVLQPQGDGCASILVTSGDRVLDGGALDPAPVTEAYVAEVPDGPRLLVVRQDQPRGGFSTRLYVERDGALSELTDAEDNPLVPFVATDTVPGTPVSVSCTDDGIAVSRASLDPGNPNTWTVEQTTYAIADGVAEAREGAGESVAADRLGRDYPELTDNVILEDCRVG